LAVYREVAAHLSQVDGVRTQLVPLLSQSFDYHLSQVDSLALEYPGDIVSSTHQRVEQILAYYGDRYGVWEIIQSPTTISPT
jgi:hypothetical protein